MKYLVITDGYRWDQTDELTDELRECVVMELIDVIRFENGQFEQLAPNKTEWLPVRLRTERD